MHIVFRRGGPLISERISHSKEIEAVITQVQGVISARVIANGSEIVEVHVLADHNRTAKQVVRDIESAVLVKLGTSLDHKRISVAQLGEAEKPLHFVGCRPALSRINYATGNNEISVTITLSFDDEPYAATVTGPNTKQHRLRLAAKATLDGVEKILDVNSRLVINDAEKLSIANQEAVVTIVSLCLEQREETLLGVALNKGDDLEAAARAALDAVNRRLTIICK